MSSDIKLDGDWVIVEGKWTRIRTLDLMLDAPERRSNQAGLRRALVHNRNDGLTINYEHDYPGGVTVYGNVTATDNVKIAGNLAAKSVSITGDVKTTGDLSAKSVSVTGDVKTTGDLSARSVSVDGRPFVHCTQHGFVLGNDNISDVIVLQGRGLQINHGLQVIEEAIFNQAVRTPDITIAPAPGTVIELPPMHGLPGRRIPAPSYSLLKKMAELEAKVDALEAKVAALESKTP